MFIIEDPEKALIDFGHERLKALEVALEENRKILFEDMAKEMMEEIMEEEMEEKLEVEAIATVATLQLFNLEKLVEEEVAETGNNLDYIENLLDIGGDRLEHEEDQGESGKEQGEVFDTLRLALSEDDDEEGSKDAAVDEEDLVFTQANPEEQEAVVGEKEMTIKKDKMEKDEVRDEEEEQVKMQENEEEKESSSRKRKREEEEEEVEGKRSAKRFCGSWRTWMAELFTSWFNFNFGYFVELYNGLSDVFVRPT